MVGRKLGVRRRRAADALRNIAVAGAAARGKARREHFGRRGDEHDAEAGIAAAQRRDDAARHVAHHGPAGADVVIDPGGEGIFQPVRLPPEGEGALFRGGREVAVRNGLVVLRRGGRPGDDAEGKYDRGVAGEPRRGRGR